MNNNKVRSFLISGTILILLALSNIDRFNIFYEGIALALGVTSLVLAWIEYKKKIDQEKN